MDAIDKEILSLLQEDGKKTHVEIARNVRLSPPSVLERIKKLLHSGIIRRYTVILDAKLVGSPIAAFINVRIGDPRHEERFISEIMTLDEVLECHRVTGEYSFLLKVKTGTAEDLNSLIARRIRQIDGVSGTNTHLVLESAKEGPGVSLKFLNLDLPSSRVSQIDKNIRDA